MLVLRTCVNEQVSENVVTKTGLREHTLYCSPDKFLRPIGEDLLRGREPLSTRISGVTGINTISHLLASEGNLLGIDYDNVVTAVYVRGVARLVLAAKDKSNARSETTKREICRVNDNPLLVHSRFVQRYCLVALCVHCLDL